MTLTALAMISSTVQAEEENTMALSQNSRAAIQVVAPALDQLTQERLLGEVWKRPGLDVRDRSLSSPRLSPVIKRSSSRSI
jgi:4-carboxymuconolactone decarboxylase